MKKINDEHFSADLRAKTKQRQKQYNRNFQLQISDFLLDKLRVCDLFDGCSY